MERIYDAAEVQLPGGNASKWWWAGVHMGTDVTMACPARHTAMWLASAAAAGGASAYLFQVIN